MTGKVRPFTTDGKKNTKPAWSGDGRWILPICRNEDASWFSGRQRWIQVVGRRQTKDTKGSDPDPVLYSPRWKVVDLPQQNAGSARMGFMHLGLLSKVS